MHYARLAIYDLGLLRPAQGHEADQQAETGQQRPRRQAADAILEALVHYADASLPDPVHVAPRRRDGVDFIEKIDAACRLYRIENHSKLLGGFTHELRDEVTQHHREERKLELAGKLVRAKRLAGTGWPGKEYAAARFEAALKFLALAHLCHDLRKFCFNRTPENYVIQALRRVGSGKELGEVASRRCDWRGRRNAC